MADEFNFDGAEEMTAEQIEREERRKALEKSFEGKYVVEFEQCGPGVYVDIFDNLEDAIECAMSQWGDGCVGIRMPDGSYYEFPENWNRCAKINIIRLRKGPLNPKQEYLLKLWKRYFPVMKLEHYVCCPSHLWDEIKDCGEAIQQLYIDSLDWGLFEIVDWINGDEMATNESIDRRLGLGGIRSV